MELLFLLIFFLFIILNVVIGLVSSRAKKRKAALQRPAGEHAPGVPEPDRRQEGAEAAGERGVRGGYTYFLQEQTSDTLVQSMYEETEQRERERSEAVEKSEASGEEAAEEKAHVMRLDVQESAQESDRTSSFLPPGIRQEEEEESSPPRSGWEHVKRLPSLQQAVILSEILGQPRALSERTHSHQ
jgi:hypothetical protein